MDHEGYWWIAGAFCLVATCITFSQVLAHSRHNPNVELRRYVLRIIFMVPVYGLQSWLGLKFTAQALYFDLIRDCYEALVIYSFYQLLLFYLGGEVRLTRLLRSKHAHAHLFPFCCLPTWKMHSAPQLDSMHSEQQTQPSTIEAVTLSSAAVATAAADGDMKQSLLSSAAGDSAAATAASLPAPQSGKDEAKYSYHSFPRLTSPAVDSPAPGTPAAAAPDPLALAVTTEPAVVLPPPAASHASGLNTTDLRSISSANLSDSSSPSSSSAFVSLSGGPAESGSSEETSEFLLLTQIGTLQYCVCKPATAFVAFLLQLLGTYGDGEFDPEEGYPYLSFVTNCSQIWAMYCLILFYHALRAELKPLRPVAKFLCVKAVVFFTFWQSVALTVLARMGVVHGTDAMSEGQVQSAIQDFIVCIEMALAAIAHHYAFHYTDFTTPAALSGAAAAGAGTRRTHLVRTILDAVNVSDVYVGDVRRIARSTLTKKKKQQQQAAAGTAGAAATPLLDAQHMAPSPTPPPLDEARRPSSAAATQPKQSPPFGSVPPRASAPAAGGVRRSSPFGAVAIAPPVLLQQDAFSLGPPATPPAAAANVPSARDAARVGTPPKEQTSGASPARLSPSLRPFDESVGPADI